MNLQKLQDEADVHRIMQLVHARTGRNGVFEVVGRDRRDTQIRTEIQQLLQSQKDWKAREQI